MEVEEKQVDDLQPLTGSKVSDIADTLETDGNLERLYESAKGCCKRRVQEVS